MAALISAISSDGPTMREVPESAMAWQPPAQGLLVPASEMASMSNCQYARRVTFTLHDMCEHPQPHSLQTTVCLRCVTDNSLLHSAPLPLCMLGLLGFILAGYIPSYQLFACEASIGTRLRSADNAPCRIQYHGCHTCTISINNTILMEFKGPKKACQQITSFREHRKCSESPLKNSCTSPAPVVCWQKQTGELTRNHVHAALSILLTDGCAEAK